uniref:Histidine-containing phosphotransfer protein n=1 Tax=Fagus sylvatica TaxID=28930 RepID=A0A2N9FK94_FAGSY
MVGIDLRQQLQNYIESMHEQGILDHNFHNVQDLQNEENPHFVLEVVTMFCNDAENGIAQLARYLDELVVDYPKVTGLSHQLRGSSSSVGGHRMALACRELRRASDVNNKEGCFEALGRVRHEYRILRDNLNNISQMERSIITNAARRGQQ